MAHIAGIREGIAERVGQHRKRKRDGVRCLTIEINQREIRGLIRHQLLDGEKRDDTDAIIGALYRLFDRTIGM